MSGLDVGWLNRWENAIKADLIPEPDQNIYTSQYPDLYIKSIQAGRNLRLFPMVEFQRSSTPPEKIDADSLMEPFALKRWTDIAFDR